MKLDCPKPSGQTEQTMKLGMKAQKNNTLSLVFLTGLAMSSAQAELYNVDFNATGSGSPPSFPSGTMTGAAATGTVGDTWNGIAVTGTDPTYPLVDSTGAASPVTVTVNSANINGSWDNDALAATDAVALMADYININAASTGATATVSVNNLALNSNYVLHLYGAGDASNQLTQFAVAGANEVAQSTLGGSATPLASPQHYVTFTGNTGATGVVDISWTHGGTWTAFNGFSITTSPPELGNVNSVTLTPGNATTTYSLPGGPPVQLSVSTDYTIAGVTNTTTSGTVYTSSNESVATTSANGRVSFLAPGTTTITATVTGDDSVAVSDTTTFTVEAPTSATFSLPNPHYLFSGSAPLDIDVTASSTNVTDAPLEGHTGFSYSITTLEDIGVIDPDTGLFTGNSFPGTETITVELAYPGGPFTATTGITVEDPETLTASFNTTATPFDTIYIGGAPVAISVEGTSTNIPVPVVLDGNELLEFETDDPLVALVANSGLVTPGTDAGSATITISFFETTPTTLAITTAPIPDKPTTLLHRYSFSGTPDDSAPESTVIVDSVGMADGEVLGTGALFDATGTSLILPGGADADGGGYVNLPNGILSTIPNVDTTGVTLEVWMTNNATTAWVRAFDFGNNTAGEGNASTTQTSTIDLIARRSGGGEVWTEFTLSRAAFGTQELRGNSTIALDTLAHLVLTLDPQTGTRHLYLDGVSIGSDTIAFDNNSIAALDDVNNWLGRSNAADNRLQGSFDEVRIHSGIMTASQVVTNNLAGPDTIAVPSSYGTWATANAGGQSPEQDFDNDGVQNGVEYFMGETGSSFTPTPCIVDDQITWPFDSSFDGSFTVQTSPDLETWTNVPSMIGIGSISYDIPAGNGPLFIRLEVTPSS